MKSEPKTDLKSESMPDLKIEMQLQSKSEFNPELNSELSLELNSEERSKLNSECFEHKNFDLWSGQGTVLRNDQVAEDTFRLCLYAPELAEMILPGQFVMLRLSSGNDPLLGRPLAVYQTDLENGTLDVLYLVVGKMTRRLTEVLPGQSLKIWGPLGNGWNVIEPSDFNVESSLNTEKFVEVLKKRETLKTAKTLKTAETLKASEAARLETSVDHLVMVAGGIGQTPFFLLAQQYLGIRRFRRSRFLSSELAPWYRAKKVSLLFGAKNRDRLCCLDEFRALGVDVEVATEDGSEGHPGLVTELMAGVISDFCVQQTQSGNPLELSRTKIVACGPYPMLAAVKKMSDRIGVPCWTSLESPMACGLGICFSCVVDYLDDNGKWDYRRTCVDGPVFDASRLKWN